MDSRLSPAHPQPSRAPLAWTAPVDHWRVNLEEEWEVYFWTRALDCSEQQLRSAIAAVGHSAGEVRRFLEPQ